jgi:hypothetical protein
VGARGNGAEAIGRDAGVSIAVGPPGGQRREGNSDARGTCQRRKRSARRDAELSRGSNREARLGGWERGLHRLFRFSPEMDRPLPLALSSTIVAACLSPKIPGEPCLHGCVPPRFLPAQPVENSWLWPVRPLARTPTVCLPSRPISYSSCFFCHYPFKFHRRVDAASIPEKRACKPAPTNQVDALAGSRSTRCVCADDWIKTKRVDEK